MTQEQENSIRSQARRCIAECDAALAMGAKNRDAVTRPIILRHYSEIQAICKPFSRFLVAIGVLTGQLKER